MKRTNTTKIEGRHTHSVIHASSVLASLPTLQNQASLSFLCPRRFSCVMSPLSAKVFALNYQVFFQQLRTCSQPDHCITSPVISTYVLIHLPSCRLHVIPGLCLFFDRGCVSNPCSKQKRLMSKSKP
jgi:hypothetical protein